MAKRKIRTDDDPILRKTSKPVAVFDEKLGFLLDDMKETMKAAEGIGLAAVQVGILKRVVVVDMDGRILELVNPEITATEGEQCDEEGCLSLPNRHGKTLRPMKVTVKAQDRNGTWHIYAGEELGARCFCHELDHLDGVLYIDRLAPGAKVETYD